MDGWYTYQRAARTSWQVDCAKTCVIQLWEKRISDHLPYSLASLLMSTFLFNENNVERFKSFFLKKSMSTFVCIPGLQEKISTFVLFTKQVRLVY